MRTRRNPRLLVIGIICICVGALGMTWLWNNLRATDQAVVVVNDIYRGEQIARSDLELAQIQPGSRIEAVPAESLETIVGSYAVFDLEEGSVVSRRAIGPATITPDSAQIGLKFDEGRIVNVSLPPRTPIWLIDSEQEFPPIDAIIVTTPTKASDQVNYVVDVEVQADQAAQVAALGAHDRLSLVRKAS